MPTLNQVYRDPILTDVLVRYSNDNFIADQVFPTLPVTKETNYVFKFDKENLRPPVNSQRGLYDRAERVDFSLSQVAVPALIERSLEIALPWKIRDQAQAPLNVEVNYANTVVEKIMIEKENALSSYLANTSNVTQNSTLSGTSQWSDYTNSHPLVAIRTAFDTIMQNSAKKPNTAVMGRQVFTQLINHPDITDRIKYTARADVAEITNALADLFGVEKVLVGDSIYNSAAEGISDSLGFSWGKHFWLMYVAPLPALETVSAGYHLTIPSERYVDRWTEQERKVDVIRANDYYTRYVMATEAMYLYKNAVA